MTEEGTFYLTLPSNSSMKHFPKNNTSHYHTKLPRSFHLNSDYEVGLSEIMFPNSYLNIEDGECTFEYQSDTNGELERVTLDGGLYTTPEVLVNVLNDLVKKKLGKKASENLNFEYNAPSKKVAVKIPAVGAILGFSEALRRILNMKYKLYWGEKEIISEGPVNLNRDHEAIYVYCDLVEERTVGDVMVPLLRTVPIVGKEDAVIHQIYEKPHFVRLNKRSFETVEILLSRDTGKELSFSRGKCVVTLEFRRRKPHY